MPIGREIDLRFRRGGEIGAATVRIEAPHGAGAVR
jgi:hypothetical protein